MENNYIHGVTPREQARLSLLNDLTNPSYLDFLELRESDLVLEIGSGLGILTRDVAARVPHGKVCGLERSPAQIAEASRRNPFAHLHFIEASAEDLPFEEARFDVVYCRYLLEHVPDPVRVLREAKRVMRPGGKLFVQENNLQADVLYPDCPRFDHVWRGFVKLQERLGGDATIGKKLFFLLKRAGFRHVELSIAPEVHWAPHDRFRKWMENLIENVVGARDALVDHRLATAEEIAAAVGELKAFMNKEDASCIFYWNRAKALA